MNYDALTITTAGASAPATVQSRSARGRNLLEAYSLMCLEVFPHAGTLVKLHLQKNRLVAIVDHEPDATTVIILTPQP
jgi:hypothetical protein